MKTIVKKLALLYLIICIPYFLSAYSQLLILMNLCIPEERVCHVNIRLFLVTIAFIPVGLIAAFAAYKEYRWSWITSWLFCIFSLFFVVIDIAVIEESMLMDIYMSRLRLIATWYEEGDFFRIIFSVSKNFLNPVLVPVAIVINSWVLYCKITQSKKSDNSAQN